MLKDCLILILLEVGEFYSSEVNESLSQQNDGPFPSFFGRQLISIYVQPLRVEVFGMDSRPHGRYNTRDGSLQLGHLPSGLYLLRMSDAESGAPLGVQRVVKAGG